MVGSGAVGDVAAFPHPGGLGHSSIYLGGGLVIYAGETAVKIETVGYVLSHGHSSVTYRRYSR